MSAPPPPGPVWPPPGPVGPPPPGSAWSPSGSPAPPAGQPAEPPRAPGDYPPYPQQPYPQQPYPQQPYPQQMYPQQAYYAPGWPAPAPAPRRRRGRLLGILAGVLALIVVGGVTVGVVHWQRTRPIGEVTAPRSATARQVATGHCIADLPADGTVTTVSLVPCEDEHEAEVVGVLALRAESWPGQDAVDREAGQWCEMDARQSEAGFRAVVWTPSQAAWGQGDHQGVCLAWYDGGGVTGSFRTGDVTTP